MTIRHLTVFAAVAEQGSMSAAAKHLYLFQLKDGRSKKLILVIDQLEFPVPFPCFITEDPD